MKEIMMSMLNLVKHEITLMNQIKNKVKKIDKISRRLLELKFEENPSIKSTCLNVSVERVLPSLRNM